MKVTEKALMRAIAALDAQIAELEQAIEKKERFAARLKPPASYVDVCCFQSSVVVQEISVPPPPPRRNHSMKSGAGGLNSLR